MIRVRVKFVASELTNGLSDGFYQVAEGATVRELLAVCEQQRNAVIPPENFRLMLLMLNGKNALLDTPINEDATLHVCRIIIGG